MGRRFGGMGRQWGDREEVEGWGGSGGMGREAEWGGGGMVGRR